ncbi:uncharacterized protein LOC144450787 [Glandiceps talaboti]
MEGVRRLLALAFLLFVGHDIHVCKAVEADLEMMYVIVNSVRDIIPLDEDSGLIPVINFKNNGPSDIAEATDGADVNFKIHAYLSDSVNRAADAVSQDLGYLDSGSLVAGDLRKAVAKDHTRGFTLDGVNIRIPSTACEQVNYFCVDVELDPSTNLTDPDLTNNFHCKEFNLPITDDDKIGIFKCYIDIETTLATVTAPSDITYLAGTAGTVTFEATIINNGGKILTTPLAPKVYLTDNAQLELAAVKELQTGITVEYPDDVTPDESTTLSPTFSVDITIPTENDLCEQITHVCVEIGEGSENYVDYDPTNNDFCLEFGTVADGKVGEKYGCPVDGIDLQVQSFEVQDWENTIYDIGVDNTIAIDGVLINVGDQQIDASTSTGPNNYGFEVYLINHRDDYNQKTDEVVCTVDLAATTNLKDGLSYGNELAIGSISATCTLPADTTRCLAYQSVCLKVVADPTAPYVESHPDNNILCQEFGDNIGNKSCPILDVDIEPIGMVVTPSADPIPLDTPTDANIDIQVTNRGPGDLPSTDDPKQNFDVKVYLSDSGNLETADAKEVLYIEFADENELRQGIDKDGEISIQISPAKINLHAARCKDLIYLCVEISVHEDSIYKETNPETNDFCLQFFPPGDGLAGNTECFIDIAATGLKVTSPTDLEYKPGFETDVQVELSVTNNGGLAIPATEEGDNFVAVVFLTDSNDLNSLKSLVDVTNGGYRGEVAGKVTDLAIPGISLKITIPTIKARCEELTHVCIKIVHEDTKYIDSNSTNDFICIEFGPVSDDKAGIKNCDVNIDLSASNLLVTPSKAIYDFDVATDANIDASITNTGPGDLPHAGQSLNYKVEFFLTDSPRLEDANFSLAIDSRSVTYDAALLALGLNKGNSLDLDTDDAQLLIPLDQCLSITHICIKVTLYRSDVSVFTDPDETNNDACLKFGDVTTGKAGIIPCYVDIGVVDLEVIKPEKPRYRPDTEYELDVRLTVRNYGALSLSHTPAEEPYNFKPVLYLSNHYNIDSYRASTLIRQDDAGIQWLHEVASRVTVILDIFQISITIPDVSCSQVTHLCIQIEHEGWYVDGFEPNDKKCIPFIDGEGGLIVCKEDEPSDTEATSGLPVVYTVVIVVVVVLAVLIGVTVALCNGCKKRTPKYITA